MRGRELAYGPQPRHRSSGRPCGLRRRSVKHLLDCRVYVVEGAFGAKHTRVPAPVEVEDVFEVVVGADESLIVRP